MASKNTGFHSSDPDWTRGRAQAVSDAEAVARRQVSMAREVALTTIAHLGQEWDADAATLAAMTPEDRALCERSLAVRDGWKKVLP